MKQVTKVFTKTKKKTDFIYFSTIDNQVLQLARRLARWSHWCGKKENKLTFLMHFSENIKMYQVTDKSLLRGP